jgi:hypothetical protein
MTDPLDHFEQQFYSKELLDQHGPRLRDEARALSRQQPHADLAQLAGLIAEPESAEGACLCQLIADTTGQSPPRGLLVGLLPRRLVAAHIDHGRAHARGVGRPIPDGNLLPVVCATRDGIRVGFFALD